MGLLDQITGAIGGLTGQHGTGGSGFMEAIMQWINDPKTGGIAGLMEAFQKGGLGEIARSWVSTGANLPVSADQIQSVLGSERIQALASKLGVSTEQASGQVAEFLPQIIDKLTPNGQVPEGGDLMAQGIELLKGKLFG